MKKNNNALKDYQKASESVKSKSLRKIFKRKANERYVFGRQLQDEIHRLDGALFDKKQWKNYNLKRSKALNKALKKKDKLLIMTACERGERECFEYYNEILEKNVLPKNTRLLLQKQRNNIIAAIWNLQFKLLELQIADFTFFDFGLHQDKLKEQTGFLVMA